MLPIESLTINTIRTLAMDAVQKANSGHPGTPMALAPVAYVLWSQYLKFDPQRPDWPVRDRFVLSCGHASMLLYSLLHLAGVRGNERQGDRLAITLDDIRHFRQWGSPCAGHPEYGDAAGIETTTGPLGQGIANSVGMAIAAQWQRAHFGRPDRDLFGYRVFALCSDGDLMEGVGCEAASLAGHLRLGNLCWIYDDNHITIEGNTELAFSENVPARFEALGWRTASVEDANDLDQIRAALDPFDRDDRRPLLIRVRSVIAWGSPNKANTHGAHGSPLGEPEVRLTKEFYGWPADEHFLVPDDAVAHFQQALHARGTTLRERWEQQWSEYQRQFPTEAALYQQMQRGELPPDWDQDLPAFEAGKSLATRISSGKVLNAIAHRVPWLIGGSADLAPSTKTLLEFADAERFRAECPGGRNFHFGIREHAMAGIANGMALSRIRPYVATFFVFSDYLRPSMRLAALMHLPVLYVFTHDSIGLGEDGPTHQPVEHLAACRAIPRLIVIRPADANEVSEAYRVAMETQDRPVALVLTRQDLPTLSRTEYGSAEGLRRGAYVMADSKPGTVPALILIGTGSELHVAASAYQQLEKEGMAVRLVSMPSWELFERQPASYRDSVLPPEVSHRIAVEAGVSQGWERYLGSRGQFIGLERFGASAPYEELYEHFGITAEHVLRAARQACVSRRSG